jgi:L,D-transpeptidase YcbB
MSVFVVCILFACHENQFNPDRNLSRDDFSGLSVDSYRMSVSRINEQIAAILKGDSGTLAVDRHARGHYLSGGPLLWVTRHGVTSQADTLLRYLKTVDAIGFSQSSFFADQIEADLEKMKSLDFAGSDINEVAARLDYNLTKAYLRYAMGQRYGFVNPYKALNGLDLDPYDTLKKNYRVLYDVKTELPDGKVVAHLLGQIARDSVANVLQTAETDDPLYRRLKALLPSVSGAERTRVLVNMERCRWRHDRYPSDCDKYVLVNIPAYELLAVEKGNVQRMKVVCGKQQTKTPLLNSAIMRMDVNPKWAVPTNIVKHEMSRHAGDADYFARNNYVVTDKNTGVTVLPEELTEEDLRTGNYRVVQEGGEQNSLGRIIFRFNNNFSIYLHDTPTRSAFSRADRGASHGCVRVEKPFDLACFLLKGKSESVLDNLKYSMQVSLAPSADDEEHTTVAKVDKSRLIRSLEVKPHVPLFITYFTKLLMPDGRLESFGDVYGYDRVIANKLKGYTKH